MTNYNFESDLNYFIANQDELVLKYNGKQLVIHNQEVINAFDTVGGAFDFGCAKFGAGHFSIQRCIPGKAAYTSYIY